MIQASYTTEGIRGIFKEGGSSRATTIEKMITGLGGRMESFYFAFGSDDVYVTADLPDNATAASIGLTVTASSAVRTKTVVLLTPEEIDRATQRRSITEHPAVSRPKPRSLTGKCGLVGGQWS